MISQGPQYLHRTFIRLIRRNLSVSSHLPGRRVLQNPDDEKTKSSTYDDQSDVGEHPVFGVRVIRAYYGLRFPVLEIQEGTSRENEGGFQRIFVVFTPVEMRSYVAVFQRPIER